MRAQLAQKVCGLQGLILSVSHIVSFQLAVTFQSAEVNNKKLLPCLIEPELCQALHDSPAVLVHGPASAHSADIWFHHFRDKDGHEVDLVLERSMRRLAR